MECPFGCQLEGKTSPVYQYDDKSYKCSVCKARWAFIVPPEGTMNLDADGKTIIKVKQGPYKIMIDNAGKTCLVNYIMKRPFSSTLPTVGLDTENAMSHEGWPFLLIDLGGYPNFRKRLWKRYILKSQGIIFIIDGNDVQRLNTVKDAFWEVLEWISFKPLLILKNKSDLDYIDDEDLHNFLELERVTDQYPSLAFKLSSVSIKDGIDVEEALKWFYKRVNATITNN